VVLPGQQQLARKAKEKTPLWRSIQEKATTATALRCWREEGGTRAE